jgi:hypothetical protein
MHKVTILGVFWQAKMYTAHFVWCLGGHNSVQGIFTSGTRGHFGALLPTLVSFDTCVRSIAGGIAIPWELQKVYFARAAEIFQPIKLKIDILLRQ